MAANFKALAQETAAYAYDTGRNRKDLMKAQIENLNRTDASTYSMMLRMKGEEGAAETFEKNLSTVVGGGVKTIEDIRHLLLNGADKVSFNSAAIKNPDIISSAANKKTFFST